MNDNLLKDTVLKLLVNPSPLHEAMMKAVQNNRVCDTGGYLAGRSHARLIARTLSNAFGKK